MAYHGERSTLTFGSAISKLLSIDHSGDKKATIDTTCFDSVTGGDKEFRVSALNEGGEVTAKVLADATAHSGLKTTYDAGTLQDLVVALKDGDGTAANTMTWTWSDSALTGIKLGGVSIDGNAEIDLTFKCGPLAIS